MFFGKDSMKGENPVQRVCYLRMVHIHRVAFPGTGAPIGWYISSEAQYLLESDSEQVPRGKGAKYFEKRVKRA